MVNISIVASVVAVLYIVAATPLQAATPTPITIDTTYCYTLRNDYMLTYYVLAIEDPLYQLNMQEKHFPLASTMYWKFVPLSTTTTPKYAIRNMALGDAYSLDVWNSTGVEVRMKRSGTSMGQVWSVTPWYDGMSFGFTNEYTGGGKRLDVYQQSEFGVDGLQALLRGGNVEGQH